MRMLSNIYFTRKTSKTDFKKNNSQLFSTDQAINYNASKHSTVCVCVVIVFILKIFRLIDRFTNDMRQRRSVQHVARCLFFSLFLNVIWRLSISHEKKEELHSYACWLFTVASVKSLTHTIFSIIIIFRLATVAAAATQPSTNVQMHVKKRLETIQ